MASVSRAHKERKRNFTATEGETVADFVLAHYDELYGVRSKHATPGQREALWRQLADEVTAMGQEVRTAAECRRRWQDEKARVKRLAAKEADASAQMGTVTPADLLSARDRRIARVMDSALIVGLGECDTELPLSGAGSSAQGTQPSTSGVTSAQCRAVVAESSSEDEDVAQVQSPDIPVECGMGGQAMQGRQGTSPNIPSAVRAGMAEGAGVGGG